MSQKTVVVGMSGGVDSAVCAALLKEQGYRVIGLFMKNWDDGSEECPATEDYEDVARICQSIGIPYYSVNFVKQYWDSVFSEFLEGLKRGITPNPDVLCNREIKFKVFFQKAMEMGADFVATGHYCRTHLGSLMRGRDSNKDQSYFLYALKKEILEKVLFPIGDWPKKEVRAFAAQKDLCVATKKDSTGICFIGERHFKEFIGRYIPFQEGSFETPEGVCVGRHQGCAFYTVGQRKGLGIGGPGEAWFVVGKKVEGNVVLVVQGGEHPLLFRSVLEADELSWVGEPPLFPLRCQAQVRYRQEAQTCQVEQEGERIRVTFDQPQRAVTPGQAVVLYQDETCLGGGTIL
jgi:tRNA-specific 2-thiouridylase